MCIDRHYDFSVWLAQVLYRLIEIYLIAIQSWHGLQHGDSAQLNIQLSLLFSTQRGKKQLK